MEGLIKLILNILLLLTGITTIAISATLVSSESQKYIGSEVVFNGTSASSVWQVYTIAPGTSYASLKATIAAGCVAVAAALVMCPGILSQSDRRKHRYSGIVASGLAVIVAILALVWSFVSTYTSSQVNNGPFPETLDSVFHARTVGSRGTYSFESWNCQTIPLRLPSQRGQAQEWCALGQVSRWLTIPLLVLSIGMLGLWLLEFCQPGRGKGSVSHYGRAKQGQEEGIEM